MGLLDSLLDGLFSGSGSAFGGLAGLGNFSNMDSLTGMPSGLWYQQAKKMGMDEEEIAAFMADMGTGSVKATERLMNQRNEERNKLVAELSARPKPGTYCDPKCWIDDERCQECLAQQQKFQEAFDLLKKMENAANSHTAIGAGVEKKPTKCTLCGAPIVKGASECPYCGTAYPAGAFSSDISYSSADEAKAAAHVQAHQVCVMYAELVKSNAQRLADSGQYSKLFKFSTKFLEGLWYKYAMTADQVKQGADQYGVSRSAYIAGVINGTFTSISETAYKERKKKEEQHREEQQQRNREASKARFEQQLNMISGSAPKYVGGPQDVGYCCGNCVYYMARSNECAYSKFFHPKNASDYCNYHRSS